ncbi:hypothetical protein SAMN05444004_11726 [Jannaschia faecimaris]|uniref:Uncharacterized protein n=1 Tax=Jannaschia faecimaris TaxID=1244108 RepID=A0A1H3TIA5_9RHOB|nr:hypothetical protein SAMN05444004_11726 [Jannaschia faecimaris]
MRSPDASQMTAKKNGAKALVAVIETVPLSG